MESSNLSMRLGKLNIPNFNESVSLFISQLEDKCMVYCFPW